MMRRQVLLYAFQGLVTHITNRNALGRHKKGEALGFNYGNEGLLPFVMTNY